MELEARFRSSSRAFLRDPSLLTMRTLLAHFALHYVAQNGDEAGLDDAIDRISTQCRNILTGLP